MSEKHLNQVKETVGSKVINKTDKKITVNGVVITDYNKWAYNLLMREYRKESLPWISKESWREVFMFDKKIDVNDAVSKIREAA